MLEPDFGASPTFNYHDDHGRGDCGRYFTYSNKYDPSIHGHIRCSCGRMDCTKGHCVLNRTHNAYVRHEHIALLNSNNLYKVKVHLGKAKEVEDINHHYHQQDVIKNKIKNHVEYAELFLTFSDDYRDDSVIGIVETDTPEKLREMGFAVSKINYYEKELEKIMWKYTHLSGDEKLDAYIQTEFAYKKRVRKIGLRGEKTVSIFIKVPAVKEKNPFATIYCAVIRNGGLRDRFESGSNEIVTINHNQPTYPTKSERVEFDELWNNEKFWEERRDYFPYGFMKKGPRCRNCKKRHNEMKSDPITKKILEEWIEEEKGKFGDPICGHTGRHCALVNKGRKRSAS